MEQKIREKRFLNISKGLFVEIRIKKWIFHEKQLDIDHAKKEAGYLLVSCNDLRILRLEP